MPRLPRIPDLLTTANLCCGVGSILLASQEHLTLACWLVFAGAFFDVLDGLAARALGGGSELGKQLDSLADMVTFGVAPGVIIGCAGLLSTSAVNNAEASWRDLEYSFYSLANRNPADLSFLGVALMILVVASAWRLAKFNVDSRQSSGFLGLPTPANALFWAALVLASQGVALPKESDSLWWLRDIVDGLLESPSALFAAALAMGILMLSELPLPGLKFKHFKWRGNEVIYLLLGIGAVLVVLYGMLAVPLIMVLYILSPLWGRVFGKGV